MISVFSNSLGKTELERVAEIFKSRWVGRGAECIAFEKDFAGRLGVNKVFAVNNCTAGIYLAIRTLRIGPGDEVILSTVNFVACLSAVLEAGAVPVFADVDPITLNILPDEIERLKTHRTKAIIVLHYGGHPAPMDEILAAANGVPVIEDNACSPFSKYQDRPTGTIGDFGTWSFDAMKILVTGDGGMVHCKPEYYTRLSTLRYLGLDESGSTGLDKSNVMNSRWWEYELKEPSGRFIMNDITAAIGRSQLRKVDDMITVREAVWNTYQEHFTKLSGLFTPPEVLPGCVSSYYLYWVRTKRRDELAMYLKTKGIYTTFRYYPLHLVAKSKVRLPNAEEISNTTLNLPLHQNLTCGDLHIIIDAVKGFGW